MFQVPSHRNIFSFHHATFHGTKQVFIDLFVYNKNIKMKPILCIGMVCEDTVVKINDFPIEDSDQRTLDQWKTRGGNASNMSTVIASFDLPVE